MKTKTICDSVNHNRPPKEVLPDWACRDVQVMKGRSCITVSKHTPNSVEDTSMHYYNTYISLLDMSTDSMNHNRLPKVVLPAWACRDVQVVKGRSCIMVFQTFTSNSVEDSSMHCYNTYISLLDMSAVMWLNRGD